MASGREGQASSASKDVWDSDSGAREWWTKVARNRESIPNAELAEEIQKYCKTTRDQSWPLELIRDIVNGCIDLRTPEHSVVEDEFRCFINMWGPFRDAIETITRSIYDENGHYMPYWAGKMGREHRFQNIGDYIIRFATSRLHLAASWKKVKAGCLVIKHVAIWRSSKGFYWVPQTNGPFVGYFKNLRDLVRDFDHTLRNPGCPLLWYESVHKENWFRDQEQKRETKNEAPEKGGEEDSVYVMFDEATIGTNFVKQKQMHKIRTEAAQAYYRKNKRDSFDYPWDAACSPTVTGQYFRAMLPSRALGVESTARLDTGFSDREFNQDKKAREALSRRRFVETDVKSRSVAPMLSKNSSSNTLPSESCLNLFETIDGGKGKGEPFRTRDKPASMYANLAVNDTSRDSEQPQSRVTPQDNRKPDSPSHLYVSTLAGIDERKAGSDEPGIYVLNLEISAPGSKAKPTLRRPKSAATGDMRRLEEPRGMDADDHEEEDESKDSIYTSHLSAKPKMRRPVSLGVNQRKRFTRKRYKLPSFNLEDWTNAQRFKFVP